MGIDEFKQNPDAKKPDATPPAEKIDPRAMVDALGKNVNYAGKKPEEPRTHDEISENKPE